MRSNSSSVSAIGVLQKGHFSSLGLPGESPDGFGLTVGPLPATSLAQEEAPVTKAEMKEESNSANSSNRAGLKMMSGMLVGLFLAMWGV